MDLAVALAKINNMKIEKRISLNTVRRILLFAFVLTCALQSSAQVPAPDESAQSAVKRRIFVGSITGEGTRDHLVKIEKGRRFNIEIQSRSRQIVVFTIFDESGRAIAINQRRYADTAATDASIRIRVFIFSRSGTVARSAKASYRLAVSL